ncbi:hypothetical protein JTE90_016576 [Oedothorax gibbosus]|uniref:Secreted protein n=1 Tax=Oedothorax gibbosus TaxID=931172 RepID=A0AAV6UBE7_9ARAC|nr:hypothetical protein JTE90_016576 [Oedothorax gibbosus]
MLPANNFKPSLLSHACVCISRVLCTLNFLSSAQRPIAERGAKTCPEFAMSPGACWYGTINDCHQRHKVSLIVEKGKLPNLPAMPIVVVGLIVRTIKELWNVETDVARPPGNESSHGGFDDSTCVDNLRFSLYPRNLLIGVCRKCRNTWPRGFHSL